ncbi:MULTISPECIES: hypothetical protein [unclassified Fusibacter]|uniref:hypothetical protein n=1 Tax=unclassified Fusibacter TaxID=2624464 RepID=UPI001012185B|nr:MULTISPECIES: hypothetical protein [unclassified Fusibacter]MCK8058365.1 hypothetical protein [Fusibacter sp. A2]NPE20948.1 hypothetical protein [Fusibacter sp. A1]RXV63150.1 hypothetical protein DWB64_03860 [Fusibacter sp. A1]
MDSSMFIKSIKIDDMGRIVVSVQDQLATFLKEDNTKQMLKEAARKALGDDYVRLEVSPTTFRVTVKEGSSEKAKELIEKEIATQIEMALSFMSQFGNQED